MIGRLVLVNDYGIRTAGNPDECFYCHQKVGTLHKEDCVILQKKVKVRYIFDIEIEVPFSWDKEMIEFHSNEGSWCSDNSIQELKTFAKEKGCLCEYHKCEVLEMKVQEPYRKIGNCLNN
jgi:hypothetical protein